MENLLWLIPVLPLAGFLINGLFGSRMGKTPVSLVACFTVLASLILSLAAVFSLAGSSGGKLEQTVYTWLQAGEFRADFGFLLDPLSSVMILVVTGVGFLIHVYSVGYMWHEEGYARYFAFLNLFMFAMLTLVMADNLLLLFVGWEGVGLCSYLLIGFYYRKDWASAAGVKAFVVNRIGDVGFAVGVFLIFMAFGTIKFTVLNKALDGAIETVSIWGNSYTFAGVCTAIGILLFIGACGKSAQIPLYVWLPDAMAGPTPVSALIHAATMVTAGIYMVTRMNVVYANGPGALLVVGVVGALTALMAASIGLVQRDIKKVLAYSTVSQLGYMFIALGVGAFTAGIFHLMTHAFFKALLFLGAGSVIHGMSGEQDIFKMGGLRKKMPVTHWTFLIACFAIAGFPPLSGFFSKDEILWKAFSSPVCEYSWVLWLIGFIAAGMTSFYMFRCYFMTFWGTERMDEETKKHIHESPKTMTIPLIVLAVLAAVGGLIGMPHVFHIPNLFEKWMHPIVEDGSRILGLHESHGSAAAEWILMGASVLMALVFASVAMKWYKKGVFKTPEKLAGSFSGLHKVLFNKYYVDEFYGATVIALVVRGSKFLWRRFDEMVIDGIANGSASFTQYLSFGLSRIQTGYVRNYALGIFAGTVVMILIILVRFF